MCPGRYVGGITCLCESCSVMSDSLRPHGLYNPWNSLGQNTEVGSFSLLQGIFPTQGSNAGLPHCRWILYQLNYKGNPRILEWVAYPFSSGSSRPRNWTRIPCTAGRFFTNWAIREAHNIKESEAQQQKIGLKLYWLRPCPPEKDLVFSHHQSLPSGSLHKPLSLLHQRADRRSKKNHSPTAPRTKTTLHWDEKAESYAPNEGRTIRPQKNN